MPVAKMNEKGRVFVPLYIGSKMLYQHQLTAVYDNLAGYAYSKAGRYFRDVVLRQDAADEAVNAAVDAWVSGQPYDEEVAKRTIQSFLRQASRKRELEPINVVGVEYQGMHGYKVI